MALRGRAGEYGRLRAFIEAHPGGTLIITGGPGTGKTALAEHALAVVPGPRVLRLSGVRAEAAFRYAALHRLLIPHLRGATLPPSRRRLLEIAWGAAEGPPADPARVTLAVAGLLTEVAAARPLLCFVDDAQWIDPQSLTVLTRCAHPSVRALSGLILAGLALPAAGGLPLPRPASLPLVGAAVLGRADSSPGVPHHALAVPPGAEAPPPAQQRFPFVSGAEVLEVGGLGEADGIALLRSAAPGPIDRLVAARLVAGTGGNPRALADLGRELTADQLTGARSLPRPLPVGTSLEEFHQRRISGLPEATRTWLLLAAADPPAGLPHAAAATLFRVAAAARRMGITVADAAPAVAVGLVPEENAAWFVDPLVRAAVYGGATGERRRRAHTVLAAVTDRPADADLRAWHRAAAAPGPDEDVAAELLRTADRAEQRCGLTSRVVVLVRAAELTPAGPLRSSRMIDAAEAALLSGAPSQASRLTGNAQRESEATRGGGDARGRRAGAESDRWADEVVRGRALLVRAGAEVMAGAEGSYARGSSVCREAALAFGTRNAGLAGEALLAAVEYALLAGDLIRGTGPSELAVAVRAHLSRDRPRVGGDQAEVVERQLRAFVALAGGDLGEAVREVRRAAVMLADPGTPDDLVLRHHLTVGILGVLLWDADLHRAVWRRVVDVARKRGAQGRLAVALHGAAAVEVLLGESHRAGELRDEADLVLARIGVGVHHQPELSAWAGERAGPVPAADRDEGGIGEFLAEAHRLGFGGMRDSARIGLVIRALGRGDYAGARAAGLEVAGADGFAVCSRVLPELVEAAIRSGDRVTAARALDTLTSRTSAAGTGWALGVRARAQALLAAADTAESCYRQAIELLGGSGSSTGTAARADLARVHLLYGEWLRRRRRRGDAREHLGTALRMFEAMGAAGFAARARQELTATGETAGAVRTGAVRAGAAGAGELTPREREIAVLAAGGATNGEIAARLFLSANTVDHHLRKAFRKLGVTSRRQLPSVLGE